MSQDPATNKENDDIHQLTQQFAGTALAPIDGPNGSADPKRRQQNKYPAQQRRAPPPPLSIPPFYPRGVPLAVYGNPNPSYAVREELSTTNIYIRGLSQQTSDDDLRQLCSQFGAIISAKSIIDHETSACKGYGFVMFESPVSAVSAINSLNAAGIQATFAKLSYNERVFNSILPEEDPTNVYISGLPLTFTEENLHDLVVPFGEVVSCRILYERSGEPRGIGFARMASRELCEKVIEALNGKSLEGSSDPLLCKFADNPSKKARMNQYHWQDHHQANYVPQQLAMFLPPGSAPTSPSAYPPATLAPVNMIPDQMRGNQVNVIPMQYSQQMRPQNVVTTSIGYANMVAYPGASYAQPTMMVTDNMIQAQYQAQGYDPNGLHMHRGASTRLVYLPQEMGRR